MAGINLFHPYDQQQAWDEWQNAIKNNSNYSIESRTGVVQMVSIKMVARPWSTFFHADGSILKWFGTCTNINDVKLAQEAIRIHSGVCRTFTTKLTQAILQAIESPEWITDTALMYMSNLLLCHLPVCLFNLRKKEVQVYPTYR